MDLLNPGWYFYAPDDTECYGPYATDTEAAEKLELFMTTY